MTDRDKKLLVFLGIFIVIVGMGWFILKPMIKSVEETKAEFVSAQQEQITVEEKMMLLPSKRTMVVTIQEMLAEEASIFYPIMQSQQVDKLLTDLALRLNCDARDLSITISENELKSKPYIFAEDTSQESIISGVYAATIKMELGGNREKLQSMLDILLNDYPAIRITTYKWSTMTARGAIYSHILSLEAEVYMFILN